MVQQDEITTLLVPDMLRIQGYVLSIPGTSLLRLHPSSVYSQKLADCLCSPGLLEQPPTATNVTCCYNPYVSTGAGKQEPAYA